jgi:hypothetical protein
MPSLLRRSTVDTRLYVDREAFVPIVRAAIGAGLDQRKPAPPEWDSGTKGFGERYGFRFGMHTIAATAEYTEGALLREDVAYHRCNCAGFFPRTGHAILSTFTARTKSGGTVLSFPSISSAYAGSFSAVNAWYPARYEPQDAFRIGTLSFGFKMGANLMREYFLPAR